MPQGLCSPQRVATSSVLARPGPRLRPLACYGALSSVVIVAVALLVGRLLEGRGALVVVGVPVMVVLVLVFLAGLLAVPVVLGRGRGPRR